ncbi:DUF4401 domain-containing protein [Pantoea sp. QMID2]|nr:DUF4401 domain-containing protein [Pantoea sp. QMID1]GME42782.1 DUF4401 domain-containing protein [Pantoea sp. QMID3]GME56811.1 DUF4401 domain-containing protein [Pantoea sp. QMID4]GME59033.1 DUF4401 domain-containing protein [Pantoea sp. QMID2]
MFFVAWNWAWLPKMAKFALTELLIVALAVVVWWRWYNTLARSALLAAGLSFGALFALYGQIYQTGADSWELFRAWFCVLLPLALIARQNSLWFCSWLVANLAFQLYYTARLPTSLLDLAMSDSFFWLPTTVLHGYLALLAACLIIREALAWRAITHHPESWLASRWFSRVMAGFLLLLLTAIVAGNISDWCGANHFTFVTGGWVVTLLAGYYLYRYRHVDLCMLTQGIASLTIVGCALIMQLFLLAYDTGDLSLTGVLMIFWVAANGSILLKWQRKLAEKGPIDLAPARLTSLTDALRQQGLLSDAQISEIQQRGHASDLPWYLRLALSVGGWVAAIITLLLMALMLYSTDLLDDQNAVTLILPSLVLAVIARGLLRSDRDGKYHLGLAWAIAATCGLIFGVIIQIQSNDVSFMMLSSLCALPILAAMAVAMPDRTYRFMAITALTFFLVLAGYLLSLLYLSPTAGGVAVFLLVAVVMFLWLWIVSHQLKLLAGSYADAVHPLLYGIPAGLMLLSFLGIDAAVLRDFFWSSAQFSMLQSVTGTGIAAGFVLSTLSQKRSGQPLFSTITLPATVICGAAALYAPGIGLGLWLILMARYLGSPGLLVVSGGFMVLYVIDWYYFLEVILLHKALLLLAGGLVLLGLAWVVTKVLPAQIGGASENA